MPLYCCEKSGLARIAAELRSNPDFAEALLPVRFMEESPEIFSLTDFWLETMFHLANEADECDAALARELRDTRTALAPRWRERITEAQARAAVFDAADRLGKRLVLIVENLQSLCRDARDEFGWQLREVLQTEPQIILLASATSRFRELDRVDEPFFEMFRIVGLGPLNTEECSRLWKIVSGKPATPREVRPLQILTGGNPRLLVMAADFARHRSLRLLMFELVTLIDEHTEYFRGHLEVLPKTERRVYVSVIDLWQPSSASEIATRARVDVRVASTMLGRLVERGAVIRQGRGRKRLYSPAEPLYSMYYKLRREQDEAGVVENLIRFMVACYGVGELWSFSGPLCAEAAESEAVRRGIARALANRPPPSDLHVDKKWDAIQMVADQAGVYAVTMATERLDDAVGAAFDEDAFERIIKLVDDYVASGWLGPRGSRSDSRTAWTTYLLAYAHEQLGNVRDVLAVSDRVVDLTASRDAAVLLWTASTLALRAEAQSDLGDFTGAIETCDAIIHRLGTWEEPSFATVIADALRTRGCSRAHLGDDPGAISDYEDLVDRFDGSDLAEIQALVFSALMSKGLACGRLGDLEREIRSYDAILDRFDSPDAEHFRMDVAIALSFKSLAQAEIGLADQALANCARSDSLVRSLACDWEGPAEAYWTEWFEWRSAGTRALALAIKDDHRGSMDSFRAAYAAFLGNDEATARGMLRLVPALVAAGASPRALLEVLHGDIAKAASLEPLVVALHERAGTPIPAPREVREVAMDIHRRFDEASERLALRTVER